MGHDAESTLPHQSSSDDRLPRHRVPSDLGSCESDWATSWTDDSEPKAVYSGLEKLSMSPLWHALDQLRVTIRWIPPAEADRILREAAKKVSAPANEVEAKERRKKPLAVLGDQHTFDAFSPGMQYSGGRSH